MRGRREVREGDKVVLVPKYENTYESMLRNKDDGQFYSVTVNNKGDQMWVKDALGNKHNVVKTNGFYNRICREYWFKGITQASTYNASTYMASDAVLHQIDGVLLYEKLQPWRDILNNKVRRN